MQGMSKPVKTQTGLVKRGSVYWFRRRVAAGLEGHFGTDEHKFSLRTKDYREALEATRLHQLRLDQEEANVRASLSPSQVGTLSDTEIQRLTALFYAQVLGDDEYIRAQGRLADGMGKHYGERLAEFRQQDAQRVALGVPEGAYPEMDTFLKSQGIALTQGTEQYRSVAYEFAKASKRIADALEARQQGEAIDTPPTLPLVTRSQPRASNEDSWAYLVEYWEKGKKPRPLTIKEAHRVVKDFQEQNPGVRPSQLKRRDFISFRDYLRESGGRKGEGVEAATAGKYLNLLKGILSYAVANEKLESNPALGVSVEGSRGESDREPYSLGELKAFFSSPIYTSQYRPKGGAGDAAFWLPLIALYTGAREGEIASLDVGDLRYERGGWCLYFIHDPAKGRHTKGDKTRRAPVHDDLLRIGLRAYAERMRREGNTRLFPLVVSAPGRASAASWSQWYGRYLRKVVGITDPNKVFHSYRHTLRDAWRECQLPEEEGDAIVGHKNPAIGRKYGNKLYPITPLHKSMQAFHYEGLSLAHLYGAYSGDELQAVAVEDNQEEVEQPVTETQG